MASPATPCSSRRGRDGRDGGWGLLVDYDLIVVGGGAGGMAAARAGVRAGARTLLVQDGPIGGDCTFTGCVPSKTLIEAAARGEPFPRAMARVHATVAAIAATEDTAVFRREGVAVVHGRARFRRRREVEVDGRRFRARRFVLATGARPRIPEVPGLQQVAYLTSETVFDLSALPASLAVLGGGPLGCELAQSFARLGAQVTVVQSGDRLLPREEPEASQVVTDVFRREGIDVRLRRRVTQVTPVAPITPGDGDAGSDRGACLLLGSGETVRAQVLLVAAGRVPVTDGLDLDAAGVAVDDRGFIRTDEHLATTAPGVYAVGDVTGRLQLTHAADEMGRLAAANALGRYRWRRFDPSRTPWVTFTAPEVARVGMTEAQAAAHGGRVAYLPMTEVDRAVTAGQTDGFVKLIAGPRRLLGRLGGGRVLGATIVAGRGGEMIGQPALALRTGMFPGRLARTTHAYPTWSTAVQQAAAQFFLEIGGRHARPAREDPPPGTWATTRRRSPTSGWSTPPGG